MATQGVNLMRKLGMDGLKSMSREHVFLKEMEYIQQWIEVLNKPLQVVMMGAPGSGKGTYGSRLAAYTKLPHIVMSDLVRKEISTSKYLRNLANSGQLLPDSIVFKVLKTRLSGAPGFILDGFPRTVNQAEMLSAITDVDVAVNLKLREDILMAKCLGRRKCSECGGEFNVADVDVDGISMPSVLPPLSCMSKMTSRADDVMEVVSTRMEVYLRESHLVEEFFRCQGKLVDFEVCGDIEKTMPRLVSTLADKVATE